MARRFLKNCLALAAVLVLAPLFQADGAAVIPFGYWQAGYLKFVNTALTVNPNICSNQLSFNMVLGGKNRTAGGSGVTVNLTGPGTIGFYSDPACQYAITSVTVGNSGTTGLFYVMSTATGALTITASANAYISVSQTETSVADTTVWTGAAGDNIWSTPGNWSGGTAPTSTQTAIFDGTCVTFCSPHVHANINVAGVKLFAGYTGTITQDAGFGIQTQQMGWVQLGGTFVGSGSGDPITISNAGAFYLGGGTFTSTTGTLTNTTREWVIAGGTFNPNGGTVQLNGAASASVVFTPGGATYKNFYWNSQYNAIALTGTFTVSGTLTLGNTSIYNSTFNGGTINASGDVVITGIGIGGSTTTLNLVGSASQKLDASGATSSTGMIPSLNIASTGGTVTVLGTIQENGNFTYTSGAMSWGTSTISFYQNTPGLTITPGTVTYGDISFTSASNSAYPINISGTLKVGGTLTLAETYSNNPAATNGGTIQALGNVVVTNYGMPGTTVLSIAGSANQSITTTGSLTSNMPALSIDSTGGTVSTVGSITGTHSLTVNSGTVNFGTSTIGLTSNYIVNGGSITASSASLSILGGCPITVTPGTATYGNASLSCSTSGTVSITTNFTVSGTLFLGNGSVAGSTVSMPNPGAAYTLSVGGNVTIQTHETLNLHGATFTHGSLTNNGALIF